MIGGIDIGGTKVRWVALDGVRVVQAGEIITPRGRRRFMAVLQRIVDELAKRGVRRIGIGAAGTIKGSRIVASHNLTFLHGFDLPRALRAPGITFKIENDAQCFARAEMTTRVRTRPQPPRVRRRRPRRMLALVFGTGIGRAIAENGKVKMVARLERAERWEYAYQHLVATPADLAHFLAANLRGLIGQVKPDLIVIGGGKMRLNNLFPFLRRALRQCGIRTEIRRAHYRQNAVAIGAARMVQ